MQGKKVAFFGFQMKIFNILIVFVALYSCLSIIQAAPIPEDEVTEKIKFCGLLPCGAIRYITNSTDTDYLRPSCLCEPGTYCMLRMGVRTNGYDLYFCRAPPSYGANPT